MKVFRFAALAWVAAAGLFVFSLNSTAQEAPVEEPAVEAPVLEHTYDLRGLSTGELLRTPANAGIGDVLAPDRLLGNQIESGHELDIWTLRDSGEEARCWEDTSNLMYELISFCNLDGESADVAGLDPAGPQRVRVAATESVHKRIQWVLSALNEIVRARVSVKVYQLADNGSVGSGVLTAGQAQLATKSARLVGTMRGGLGERMVLQRLQHRSYLADYNVTAAEGVSAPTSEVRDLRTGEEIVAGVIVLPNGRLWLQGWHASMKLIEMRLMDTSCGRVELPHLGYSHTPMSITLDSGAAGVLDAGAAGRFMVIANCDSSVPSRKLEAGRGRTLELVNATGCLRGQGPNGRWLMTPTQGGLIADGLPIEQIYVEEPVDGPYNDGAKHLCERLSELACAEGTIELSVVGPFLGVRTLPPTDDAEAITRHEARARAFREALETINAEQKSAIIRVRAWVVAPGQNVPEGIIDGKPSEKDLDLLSAMHAPVLDRIAATLVDQRVDFMDISLAAHVRDYETTIATQTSGQDPWIGTLVLGKQVQWLARPAADGRVMLELRAGVTTGDEKFESIAWGDDKKWFIERSKSDLAQIELSGEMGQGDRLATVCPGGGGEGSLLVIVAERSK